MNLDDKEFIYQQVDGIFALEGFQVTETIQKVRAAVVAGKITNEAFLQEFLDYTEQHKSVEGFLETRDWA